MKHYPHPSPTLPPSVQFLHPSTPRPPLSFTVSLFEALSSTGGLLSFIINLSRQEYLIRPHLFLHVNQTTVKVVTHTASLVTSKHVCEGGQWSQRSILSQLSLSYFSRNSLTLTHRCCRQASRTVSLVTWNHASTEKTDEELLQMWISAEDVASCQEPCHF